MERTRQLFISCEQGDVVSVRALLEDLDVNSVDDDENTPLQVAAANGHDSVVKELIMKGAALDKPNVFGWTPLMHACRYGHSTVVGTLIQNQADVSVTNRYGASALTLAARGGHAATVRMLVEQRPEEVDLNGSGGVCEFTPLLTAAQHGHDAVLRFIIDRGCDVNYKTPSTGLTPLMLAALNGHMTTSQILIEQGGDPNLVNVNGKTALAIATIRRKREVRGYLERKTTNKPQVAPDEIKPDIIDASKHGDINRIRDILDVDLSQRDASSPQDGATPLMFAAMTGRLDIAELLVVRGCDINKQDTISGWTALMQATYHGKKNVAMYLLCQCGADVNIQAKNGCTAFDMASLIDDVDTELLRQLASKAMQICKTEKGKKTWPKQNGNIAATLPPDFSLEDHPKSGLKAWWNRLSNRFRNLKLGRTFNMSNRLAPMPLQASTSMQDLTLKTPRSPERQIQTARVETKKLLDPTQTVMSMTSYENMLIETKKSAAVYTLDINPPRSNMTSETLKPVIPPFLPAPSFALDGSDHSRRQGSHWHTAKSMEDDGGSTLIGRRVPSSPMKFLSHRSPGDLFVPSPSPSVHRNSFMTNQSHPRLFMPSKRKSSGAASGFRTMSNTTSPNSSTSGSSSVTPQQRSSHGKSSSSKGSTTSTLTPSPSPTPGKTGEDLGPMLDSLQESPQDDEVSGILKKLSLERYHPIFEEQEVDMEAFLTLTDDDLKELGISHSESRRQILTTITELNTGKGRERQQFVDTMATFQSTLRARNTPDGGSDNSNLAGWAMSEDRDQHIPSAKSRAS